MKYRAVGKRIACNLSDLGLSIDLASAVAVIAKKGFRIINQDIVGLARSRIGLSRYCLGASMVDAPRILDCSGFIKWLYAAQGLWVPRLAIQQREYGQKVELPDVASGDAIFATGRNDYYHDDASDGVGHVGIATGEGTVVHAANRRDGVTEVPLEDFVGESQKKFRGARRFLPKSKYTLTLEIPASVEIETADDLKWIVLGSL